MKFPHLLVILAALYLSGCAAGMSEAKLWSQSASTCVALEDWDQRAMECNALAHAEGR